MFNPSGEWDGYDITDHNASEAALAKLVAEFATVSPRSFSCRYSVDTKGKPIRLAHELLDLAAPADVMEAVSELFTDCDGYLDALQSAGP